MEKKLRTMIQQKPTRDNGKNINVMLTRIPSRMLELQLASIWTSQKLRTDRLGVEITKISTPVNRVSPEILQPKLPKYQPQLIGFVQRYCSRNYNGT